MTEEQLSCIARLEGAVEAARRAGVLFFYDYDSRYMYAVNGRGVVRVVSYDSVREDGLEHVCIDDLPYLPIDMHPLAWFDDDPHAAHCGVFITTDDV